MGSPDTETSPTQGEVQRGVTLTQPFFRCATLVTVDPFAVFVADTHY